MSNLQITNSTTYADQLAIQLGLFQDRLPGEPAAAFLDRLYGAAYARRDRTCEGVINDLAYRLGLKVQAGMRITSPDLSAVITAGACRVTVRSGTTTVAIPTATIDPDDFWAWRPLSAVAEDINRRTPCTATLLIPDALAVQLAPQSSLGCSVAEPAAQDVVQLTHSGIAAGSELFNQPVPSYQLSTSGRLVFSGSPPAGTTISYIYNLSPFTLTCSEVGVLSLMDPALASTAICPDGALVYQMREFTRQILTQDSCYWGS